MQSEERSRLCCLIERFDKHTSWTTTRQNTVPFEEVCGARPDHNSHQRQDSRRISTCSVVLFRGAGRGLPGGEIESGWCMYCDYDWRPPMGVTTPQTANCQSCEQHTSRTVDQMMISPPLTLMRDIDNPRFHHTPDQKAPSFKRMRMDISRSHHFAGNYLVWNCWFEPCRRS